MTDKNIYHVHLICDNDDARFDSFDCYWQAKNTAAELMNLFQLPINARTEIRAQRLNQV